MIPTTIQHMFVTRFEMDIQGLKRDINNVKQIKTQQKLSAHILTPNFRPIAQTEKNKLSKTGMVGYLSGLNSAEVILNYIYVRKFASLLAEGRWSLPCTFVTG